MSAKCSNKCLYMHPMHEDSSDKWKVKCDYFGVNLEKVAKEKREYCDCFKDHLQRKDEFYK